jgi:hypothetical protein
MLKAAAIVHCSLSTLTRAASQGYRWPYVPSLLPCHEGNSDVTSEHVMAARRDKRSKRSSFPCSGAVSRTDTFHLVCQCAKRAMSSLNHP